MTRFFTGGAFAALREGFARYKILGGRFLQILQVCIPRGIQTQAGLTRVKTWQKSAQHELIIQ